MYYSHQSDDQASQNNQIIPHFFRDLLMNLNNTSIIKADNDAAYTCKLFSYVS